MAIVVEVVIPRASREEAVRLEDSVGRVIAERGGPPAGLMAHLMRPEGDGVRLIDVWRNEPEWRAFHEEAIVPAVATSGLSASEPVLSPAWAFARP